LPGPLRCFSHLCRCDRRILGVGWVELFRALTPVCAGYGETHRPARLGERRWVSRSNRTSVRLIALPILHPMTRSGFRSICHADAALISLSTTSIDRLSSAVCAACGGHGIADRIALRFQAGLDAGGEIEAREHLVHPPQASLQLQRFAPLAGAGRATSANRPWRHLVVKGHGHPHTLVRSSFDVEIRARIFSHGLDDQRTDLSGNGPHDVGR
jgi:hypothetical protein